MTDLQSTRPDTTDMAAVHRVFRQAFAAAPDLVTGTPAGDTGRSAVVGSYYDNILRFLRVHHEGEDALVFPRLLDRCPEQKSLVARIAAQHDGVHDTLERAAGLVPGWTASAEQPVGAALAAALTALGDVLIPHLDEEEANIVPLCADHLTAEEWGELPGHALRGYDGDKVWLILGLIRENMTDAQRDHMVANMPPPVLEMWTTVGNASFDRFIAEVRQPLQG